MLHLLEALQYLQMKVPGIKEKTLRRVSFKHLDIEQIGHVYEGLLDHTAKRAGEPYLGLAGTREKEPEIPLAELERLSGKWRVESGEKAPPAALIEFLKEQTGRSLSAIEKALTNSPLSTPHSELSAQFRTACQGDDALWNRVKPFAGLVRSDEFGYPTVIPKGSIFVTAGTDRRSSGTHYTPRSLTEPIVQYTLEPLVYVGPAEGKPKGEWQLKPAKELLELKICDMACGSGAFLVQAARYMSERLLEAWDVAKKANPNSLGITPDGEPATGKVSDQLIPNEPHERTTFALRLVAQRCLYGVDKNPLAVEMAKLSLWLLTLAKDKPFEFLDHAIRCGDSLVGIHNIEQLKNFSLKKDGVIKFHWTSEFQSPIDEAIKLRLQLEQVQATSLEDVKEQKKLHDQAQDKMIRLRCSADLLVAAEFWGDGPKDKMERLRHNASMAAHYLEDRDSTTEFEQLAAKERRGQSMFHWALEFPEVMLKRGGFDAFVGNPPFMGGQMISNTFGHSYRQFLIDDIACGKKGSADLCTYFLLRQISLITQLGHLGIITTNTISEGETRNVGLSQVTSSLGVIHRAIVNMQWPGSAALAVCLIWITRGQWKNNYILDEHEVDNISSSLIASTSTVGTPQRLALNKGFAFKGSSLQGIGFLLSPDDASEILKKDSRYSEVLAPYLGGGDITKRPDGSPSRWTINFYDWPLEKAESFPICLDIVRKEVKPQREIAGKRNTIGARRAQYWWRYDAQAKPLYDAIVGLPFVWTAAETSKYVAIVKAPSDIVYGHTCIVFPIATFSFFAVTASAFHIAWMETYSASLESRLKYTVADGFETFAFPCGVLNKLERKVDNKGIGRLGECGHAFLEQRLLICKGSEIGITDCMNRFHDKDVTHSDTKRLRELHVEMDQAVAAAYGWTDLDLGHGFHDTKQGLRFTISEPARREVLQRLLKLNHERYAEEVKAGLHQKKKSGEKRVGSGGRKKAAKQEPGLFDGENDE